MPHSTPLITTIVGGLVLAFILAAIAVRLKLPPLIGYLCAGILAGPHTPGFMADPSLANELAELGVILLMFGVGLHFSLKDLLSVKNIAVPGAIVQIAVATLLGLGLSQMLGWSMGAGLLFGLALSVASTVVLIKAMEERNMVETREGRIAVGWLIVEDLGMVAALVLIPALSGVLGGKNTDGDASLWMVLGLTVVKVAAFVAIMLIIGRRVIPWILERVVYTGNRELFRLGVLACALGVAYGATALFGVSFALGAFFAGMVMAESEFSQRAADESLPLRDAFSVLFFVSVGMLFDPLVVVRDPWGVLATFLIILVGKSIAAYFIVRAFRYPKATALTISVSLAQIGEFSFILAGLGVSQEILPKAGQDLVLAGSILTILVNPLLFNWLDRYRGREEKARVRPEEPDPGV
jgi:CPA2 family monovalent cation:H+ antiporter-2